MHVCVHVKTKMHNIEKKKTQIILSTKLQLILVNTLFISRQLQRDKATLFDSHIAASCLLHSAAAAVRWDTMTAASWGSNTTYTWKITSRLDIVFAKKIKNKKYSEDAVTFTIENALFSL